GYLWVGTGDAATATVPQDPTSLGGKVLRITTTGAGAPGNAGAPFRSEVYTYGHRNVQGLAFDPDGTAYAIEHGTNRDDEVNLLADHLVDDVGHPQPLAHPPHPSHIPEPAVTGPLRQRRGAVHRCGDVGGLAQIPLRDDLRLAVHSGDLAQVVVGLATDLLAMDACHTLGHTASNGWDQAPSTAERAGQPTDPTDLNPSQTTRSA
ncbi:MAG: hypothetical protein GEV09_27350, partial [Pseudonocardiaceae bacterium]|nr:hypothetical protein [Pseudonocardiaceae bacterium]